MSYAVLLVDDERLVTSSLSNRPSNRKNSQGKSESFGNRQAPGFDSRKIGEVEPRITKVDRDTNGAICIPDVEYDLDALITEISKEVNPTTTSKQSIARKARSYRKRK